MLVVVRPKSKSRYKLSHDPNAWEIILQCHANMISDRIPLTKKAIDHWAKTRNDVTRYTSFKGLDWHDALSIISATKRGEAMINVDRWGRAAFYQIKEGGKNR